MQRLSKALLSSTLSRVSVAPRTCVGTSASQSFPSSTMLSRFLSTPSSDEGPVNPVISPIDLNTLGATPVAAPKAVAKELSLDELVRSIDTTLTPEQQEYVAMLKKKMRGGARSPRSIYREVPREDEIEGMGNFVPKMAENAEALIDYALSHIPKRDGPRRSKDKKRQALRLKIKVANDARRKEETRLAKLRKEAKQAKVREQVNAIREQAKIINETKRLRAEVQEQRRLKAQQQQK